MPSLASLVAIVRAPGARDTVNSWPMAAQLWLLRHGEAEPHDARPDPERRLTPRGEEQSDFAGLALARLEISFTRVFTSPYVRALDTAKRACEALELQPETRKVLAGNFDADAARALMDEAGEDARILVVGHEPDFSQTVAQLTGATIDLKKGGLAAVRMTDHQPELIVLMRPRELQGVVAGPPPEWSEYTPSLREQDLVGLSVTEGTRVAEVHRCLLRVVVRDGRHLGMTADLRPNRANVAVQDDRIIRLVDFG